MSKSKTRPYEEALMPVLEAAGAKVVKRGHDGGGHILLTIECRGHLRKFHFAKTGRQKGTNIQNTKTRLKRLIAGIPQVEKQMDESA